MLLALFIMKRQNTYYEISMYTKPRQKKKNLSDKKVCYVCDFPEKKIVWPGDTCT